MTYYRVDLQQVNRSEWRGYVRETGTLASAKTRPELLDFIESKLQETHGGPVTLIVTAC